MSLQNLKRWRDEYPVMAIETSKGVVDHAATVGDVLEGYMGGNNIQTSDGVATLSSKAEQQLFAKIGLKVATLREFEGHPDFQRQIVDLKRSDNKEAADTKILLRGKQDGVGQIVYGGILDADFIPTSNAQILSAMNQALPETALVHMARLHGRQMQVRVVDESWTHNLGPGGNAYTGLVVHADELGRSSFSVLAGVARVACWNYTLAAQPVFEHKTGFLMPQVVTESVGTAVAKLDSVANGVKDKLLTYQDVDVSDVGGMFQAVAASVDMPEYALTQARSWYDEFSGGNTLFWVIQALSRGANRMTTGRHRRWEARTAIEYKLMDIADGYVETGEVKICTCDRCGQPLQSWGEGAVDAEYEIVTDD